MKLLNNVILALSLICLVNSTIVMADAGVFAGSGQNLRQISSEKVKLKSIDVTIIPGRGPFLFDGSVPGMDQAKYKCNFLLENLTDKDVSVKIGFPLNSEIELDDPKEVILNCDFIVRDERNTYHVDLTKSKSGDNNGRPLWIFTWEMDFKPREVRNLTVQYLIPIATADAYTNMKWVTDKYEQIASNDVPEKNWLFSISNSSVYFINYITETGSSWAGNVDEATFTVITDHFEKYLRYRGLGGEDQLDGFYPIKRGWLFRHISPVGWEEIENGIRWKYKDFEPKEQIMITYYHTNIPTLAKDVEPFVKWFLERESFAKTDLPIVKEIILATYGKEPIDKTAKRFVKGQVWYEPKRNFSFEGLSAEQKSIIEEFDRQIKAMH